MVETYSNNAASILDGSINNSVTTLDVIDASAFPAGPQFRIRIEDELLLVTGVAGDTFTVTRGAEGTSAVSHANSLPVTHVVTAGAIDQLRIDDISTAAIGSRPAAGVEGRLFIPENGLIIQRDNGASWDSYGPAYKFHEVPALSNWTAVNPTGGTTSVATDTGGSISIIKPCQNGINISAWVKSAPATPYTVEACLSAMLSQSSQLPQAGLCFRQASDGNKFHTISVTHTNVTGFGSFNYTSLTAQSAQYGQITTMALGLIWFRLSDNGTNRKYWMSLDGLTWSLLFSHGRTTNITPDQVGFYLDSQSGATAFPACLKVLSWRETSDNV